jgi:autotransporter-associated beta strand protein
MIRFRACCPVVCAFALLAFAQQANAANIWLTTSANVSGAFQPPTTLSQTPLVNQRPADVGGSLFLWARPDAGLTLNRWSLQIVASNPDVVRFTGAEVESYNPFLTTTANVPTANRRWDRVGEVEVATGSFIENGTEYSILPEVNAFIYRSAVAKGIGPQSTGTPWKDLFYNSTATAWLLGRIDYRILGEGTSDIWVRVGPSGVSHAGRSLSQTSLFLGATADGAVDGLPKPIIAATEASELNPEKREARINVSAQHVVPNNADFDYDGDVDGADLLTLQRNLGSAPPLLRVRGDANGDGLVNGADMTIWKAQGPHALVPPGSPVPEPRSTVILLIGMMLAWKCRRVMLKNIARTDYRARLCRFASRVAIAFLLSFALAADSSATIYWTGNHSNSGAPESTYNGWGFNDNWGIGFNNSTPPSPLNFGTGQIVSFNASGRNGAGDAFNTYLNGQRTVGGIEFVSAGTTTINPGSGGPLRLGANGITTGSDPNQSNGTLTLNSRVELLNTQVWSIRRQLIVDNPIAINGHTLTIDALRNSSETVYVHGVIEGSGALIKWGPGRLTLDGTNPNTFTGDVAVSDGALVLDKNVAATSYADAIRGNMVVSNGATVRLARSNQIGDGRFEINGGFFDMQGHDDTVGELVLVNGSIFGNSNADIGRLATDTRRRITAYGTSSISLGTIFGDAAIPVDVPNLNDSLTIVAAIVNFSTAAGLVKTGSGTLTLSGGAANSFTGATTVSNGTLILAKNSAGAPDNFGAAVGNLAVNNGSLVHLANTWQIRDDATVDITGSTVSLASGVQELVRTTNLNSGTISGSGGWFASAALNNSINSAGSSAISTSYLALGAQTPISVIGDTLTISSEIRDYGPAGGFNKVGAGTLVISGANTYTGTTSISQGLLQLGNHHAIPDSSNVDITGGSLNLNGFQDTIGSLSGSGPISLGGGILTVGANSASTTYSGVISGAGGLGKIGTGTLTLAGNNSVGGTTTVSSGALTIGNGSSSGALGSGNIALSAGASLLFNRGDSGLVYAGNISGDGAVNNAGGGTVTFTGTNSHAGGTLISGGTLVLSSPSFDGGAASTTVNAGTTLRFGNHNQIKDAATVSVSGVLDMNGFNDAFDHLVLNSGTVSGVGSGLGTGLVGITSSGNSALQTARYAPLSSNSAVNVTSGQLDMTGVILDGTGPAVLRKTGPGTLLLSGSEVNTFSGETVVDQGTLVLARSVNDLPTIIANDGGVAVGGLTINSGATVQVAGYHQIKDSGTVTINGGTLEVPGPYVDNIRLATNGGRVIGTGTIGIRPGSMITSTGQSEIATDLFPQTDDFRINVVNGRLTLASTSEITNNLPSTWLTKEGAGQLVMNGPSLHGRTIVDSGTVFINSTHAGSVVTNVGGTLGGSGTIGGSLTANGRLAPGNSPGIITINGDYTQNAISVLEIEAGGTTPGNGANNHDQVRVGGVVSLNGRYDFSFVNGYVPAVGQSLVFIDTFDSDGAGPLPKGSVTPGTRPAEAYAPGLGTNPNPNIAFRVISDTVLDQVRLEFVDKREIFLDTTAGSVPWFQDIRWTDPATPLVDRNPDLADNTLVTNASGAAQTVTLNTVDPLTSNPIAQVRRLEVTDESFPITLGVDPGYLLSVTVGDAIVGNRGILELKENATTQGQLSVPTGRKVYVNGSGRLGGDGMVNGDVVVGQASSLNTATLTPGVTGAVGDLTVNGGYKQEPTGQLVIDVNGNTSNDMLEIAGVADLGGSVKFNVLNAAITPGVEYPFLAAGTLNAGDKFANIEISGLPTNVYFSVDYKYGSPAVPADGSVIAAATSGAGATYECYIIGDMNGDKVYDGDDGPELAKFFVNRNTWINDHRKVNEPDPDERSANIDGQNGANFDDLQAFLNQFPQSAAAFHAAFEYYSATIPEPSSATLAAVVSVVLASRRRRCHTAA